MNFFLLFLIKKFFWKKMLSTYPGVDGDSVAAVSQSASSSFSSSSTETGNEEPPKLLQVDIYPLSAPQPPAPRPPPTSSSSSSGSSSSSATAENKTDDVGDAYDGRRDQEEDVINNNDTNTTSSSNNVGTMTMQMNGQREHEEEEEEEQMLARHFGTAVSLLGHDIEVDVPLCCDAPTNHHDIDDELSPRSPPVSIGSAAVRRHVRIDRYRDSAQMADIMRLIGSELSEPYSIYTYLYFIHHWPDLCVLAIDSANENIVGAILCKLDRHALDERDCVLSRGYIGMLAVEESYRGHGIGTRLIRTVVELLRQQGCHEVVLETEVTNARSLSLYGRLGFIRDARLFRYYLNGGDAFRLKLLCK